MKRICYVVVFSDISPPALPEQEIAASHLLHSHCMQLCGPIHPALLQHICRTLARNLSSWRTHMALSTSRAASRRL